MILGALILLAGLAFWVDSIVRTVKRLTYSWSHGGEVTLSWADWTFFIVIPALVVLAVVLTILVAIVATFVELRRRKNFLGGPAAYDQARASENARKEFAARKAADLDGTPQHRPKQPAQPAKTQVDSWQAAEANAVSWMRYLGFRDARQTRGGSDGGLDVIASKAVAQVKFEAAQVGRPAVQRLVGANGRRPRAVLFFVGAGYSQQAIGYANEMDVALFAYRLDGTVTGINKEAREMLSRAARPVKAG